MAKLAQLRGGRDDIRQFAQAMIDDHISNNVQLATLAIAKGINPPAGLGTKQQKALAQLRGQDGNMFDRAHLGAQVQALGRCSSCFRRRPMPAKTLT